MEAAGLIEKVEAPRPLRYAFFQISARLDIFVFTDSTLRILADFHRRLLLSMMLPFLTQVEKRTFCTSIFLSVSSAQSRISFE